MSSRLSPSHAILATALLLSAGMLLMHHYRQATAGNMVVAGQIEESQSMGLRDAARVSTSSEPEARLTRLHALLKQTGAVERSRAMLGLLDQLLPNDYRRLLDACKERHLAFSADVPRLLLTAWTSLDSDAALAYAKNDRAALKVVLARWSVMAPDAALEWARANPHAIDAGTVGLIAAQVVLASPERINELLGALAPPSRGATLDVLAPDVLAHGNEYARQWLESIQDPENRTTAFDAITGALPFADALGWIEDYRARILSKDLEPNIFWFFCKEAAQDPDSAMAALDQLPAGDSIHKNALRALTQSDRAAADPEWAKSLLDRFPEEIDRSMLLGLCFAASGTKPELAMEFAIQADKSVEDTGAEEMVLDSWLVNDPATAREWIRTHELPAGLERFKTRP